MMELDSFCLYQVLIEIGIRHINGPAGVQLLLVLLLQTKPFVTEGKQRLLWIVCGSSALDSLFWIVRFG